MSKHQYTAELIFDGNPTDRKIKKRKRRKTLPVLLWEPVSLALS